MGGEQDRHEAGVRADGGGGQVRSGAGPSGGPAVPDADRGRVLDLGSGHGGDGASGAGEGEGRGGDGGGGNPADLQAGGDGRGDVQEAPGRGDGRGQRGAAPARDGERGSGAWAGGVEAGEHHAAHEVQGGGVHPDEGRGGTAHAVLQRIPAAVLFPDDGRDGGGAAADGSGDGDAGRQRESSS